jgi:hypothetical protein
MTTGSAIPYHLRVNKAVDRELFLSLLTRLAPSLNLECYQYVGLGGPFLEDFRLVHARVGIKSMICVEREEDVHRRQLFNKPIDCIECVYSTLENYFSSNDFQQPVSLWLDNTEPSGLADQINFFARVITSLPCGSIVKTTLNANPQFFNPPSDILQTGPVLHQARLERLRQKLGSICTSNLKAEDMTKKKFGKSVLSALKISVSKESLNPLSASIEWTLCCHYSDGQPMVTATAISLERNNDRVAELVRSWEFYSTPEEPLCLDMPILSTRERLALEAASNPLEILNFKLPDSSMGVDPLQSFQRYYRVLPHFSRVEL